MAELLAAAAAEPVMIPYFQLSNTELPIVTHIYDCVGGDMQ